MSYVELGGLSIGMCMSGWAIKCNVKEFVGGPSVVMFIGGWVDNQ